MKKAFGVAVILALFVSASSLWASPTSIKFNTYYGGIEDTAGYGSDYDYNDVVFSMSGTGLKLKSWTGVWNSRPTVNNDGRPFWDKPSLDGKKYNVGYCIYGGGNCGKGLAPDASYLTNWFGGTANDVYFTVNGKVSEAVSFHIASDNDVIGWYLLSDYKRTIHWVNTGSATGTFSFTPGGDFGLVANNHGGVGGETFYSQTGLFDTSHFAFFGSKQGPVPTPEPGTLALLGTGMAGVIGVARKKRRK